jgi:calcium/proton exchanger cax
MSRPPKEADYRIRDWREFNQVLGRRGLLWVGLLLGLGVSFFAGEIINAVCFARKDPMDLAFGVTAGVSAQVGLLVAPVLVLLGMIMGRNMDLIFSTVELLASVMAI